MASTGHRAGTSHSILAAGLALAARTAAGWGPPEAPTIGAAFGIASPDWVAARVNDPNLRILDVRPSVADYQHGHVPNAVFLANESLRAPKAGVPVQYLDPEEMACLFRRAGIDAGDTVVVYADGEDVLGATMAAYCLHRVGHRNVLVMDGGLKAYRNLHGLSQLYPELAGGNLAPAPDRSIFVTLEEVKELLNDPAVVFLDTRPAPDYLGNTSRWIRNGHIPGAVNLDWHLFMDPDNPHRFKPPAEMRALAVGAGLDPPDDIVVYCGTSREATLVYQVLRNVLGYASVRLYEGSWTEYCAKPSMPVVAGSDRGRIAGQSGAVAGHRPPVTERLEPYQCGSIERLHTMGGIFLASQPSVADLEQAAKAGVRTVINQRHASEIKDFDEREVVISLGMDYDNPAWNGAEELTDAVIDRTRGLLRSAERPILLHCASGNRVGAIWLAYRVADGGLSWDEAIAEARMVGLKSPAYETKVKEYLRRAGPGGDRNK